MTAEDWAMPEDAQQTRRSVHGPDTDPQSGTDAGRLRAYPAYKSTDVDWIGTIPKHWDMVRGRYLYTIDPKARETAGMDPTTTVSFVPMEAVGEYGELRLHKTAELGTVRGGYTYFRNGDVIVAKITPCFENGKGALADDLCSEIAFGSTEFFVLRPGKGLDAKFLLYITQSRNFRDRGEAEMVGAAGQKRVPPEFVYEFPIPTPGLYEQRAIAAFLDRETAKIDALIEKKKNLQHLANERVRSQLTRRFEEVGRSCPQVIVRRAITSLTDGPFGSSLRSEHYVQVGTRVIRLQNIGMGMFRDDDRAFVDPDYFRSLGGHDARPGDVLVAALGDENHPVGRACVLPEEVPEAMVKADCFRLRLNESLIIPAYFVGFMSSRYCLTEIAKHVRGATRKRINLNGLSSIRIPLPDLATQHQIVSEWREMSERVSHLTRYMDSQITHLREYRTALISAAVTGQIDVRGQA